MENGLYLTLRAIDPWEFELTQYHDEGGEWVYDWVDWAYCNINTAKSFELQGYTFARPIVKTGRLATESWVLDLLARLSAQGRV